MAYNYQGPGSSAALNWLADNNQECFTVGLTLRNGDNVHLFRFSGSRWGQQEEESKDFATQLADLIGVPLSR